MSGGNGLRHSAVTEQAALSRNQRGTGTRGHRRTSEAWEAAHGGYVRARRVNRLFVASLVCASAGCGGEDGSVGTDVDRTSVTSGEVSSGTVGSTVAVAAGGWSRIPDPPMTARNAAVAAWAGGEVIVVGGHDSAYECPPGGDCALKLRPVRTGAAYDPVAGQWREIAPAPVGLMGATATATVLGDLYFVARESNSPSERSSAVLRYSVADDAWRFMPPIGDDRGGPMGLVDAGGRLVAFGPFGDGGMRHDYVIKPGDDSWQRLPDDPRGPTEERWMVWVGDRLHLFATPLDGDGSAPAMRAARLDENSNTWQELPRSGASGWGVFAVEGLAVVNPHFGDSYTGGIYDAVTGSWSELPAAIEDPSFSHDIAGVIGAATATYQYDSGWALDLPSRQWIEIPELYEWTTGNGRPLTSAGTHAAAGRRLFVHGGLRWISNKDPTGAPINDAWLWTPPLGD